MTACPAPATLPVSPSRHSLGLYLRGPSLDRAESLESAFIGGHANHVASARPVGSTDPRAERGTRVDTAGALQSTASWQVATISAFPAPASTDSSSTPPPCTVPFRCVCWWPSAWRRGRSRVMGAASLCILPTLWVHTLAGISGGAPPTDPCCLETGLSAYAVGRRDGSRGVGSIAGTCLE